MKSCRRVGHLAAKKQQAQKQQAQKQQAEKQQAQKQQARPLILDSSARPVFLAGASRMPKAIERKTDRFYRCQLFVFIRRPSEGILGQDTSGPFPMSKGNLKSKRGSSGESDRAF